MLKNGQALFLGSNKAAGNNGNIHFFLYLRDNRGNDTGQDLENRGAVLIHLALEILQGKGVQEEIAKNGEKVVFMGFSGQVGVGGDNPVSLDNPLEVVHSHLMTGQAHDEVKVDDGHLPSTLDALNNLRKGHDVPIKKKDDRGL